MARYVYFDAKGAIRETVVMAEDRVGNVNPVVYMFFDGVDWEAQDKPKASIFALKPGAKTSQVTIVEGTESFYVPQQEDRKLRFFKEYQTYVGIKFEIAGDLLDTDGVLSLTPLLSWESKQVSYGTVNIPVQDSAVQLDDSMTMSNYMYLLSYLQGITKDKQLDITLGTGSASFSYVDDVTSSPVEFDVPLTKTALMNVSPDDQATLGNTYRLKTTRCDNSAIYGDTGIPRIAPNLGEGTTVLTALKIGATNYKVGKQDFKVGETIQVEW